MLDRLDRLDMWVVIIIRLVRGIAWGCVLASAEIGQLEWILVETTVH